MISINNNFSALDTARTLSGHYGRLQTSTQRLSSGLRINGAADDAAGLAIRELMRADIAALNQGVRNVNDAISMLQTFDGALGVIDEKLIRMKELAEQAATGTYDSTQRLMIDSEFQAMKDEIDRIARSTDFNGIKMLDGNWGAGRTQIVPFATANTVSIDPTTTTVIPATGKSATITPQTLTPANYNGLLPTDPLGPVHATQTVTLNVTEARLSKTDTETNQPNGQHFHYEISANDAINKPVTAEVRVNYDKGTWTCTVGGQNVAYNRTGTFQGQPYVRFENDDYNVVVTAVSYNSQDLEQADLGNLKKFDNTTGLELVMGQTDYKRTYDMQNPVVNIQSSMGNATYNNGIITTNLGHGDSIIIDYNQGEIAKGDRISFNLYIEGQADEKEVNLPDGDSRVKIHFGTLNDSAEDYYYIDKRNVTIQGLGLNDTNVKTQDKAQNALVEINAAIVEKDNARAYFGAMQNRLENTATNLRIQSENLQNAESRISDTEIALEMMNFVRNQILANSAVAMLAQANSLPQMVMSLIH